MAEVVRKLSHLPLRDLGESTPNAAEHERAVHVRAISDLEFHAGNAGCMTGSYVETNDGTTDTSHTPAAAVLFKV